MSVNHLLTVEEAQAQLRSDIPNTQARIISTDLEQSEGKVLAQGLICPIDLPTADLSMMDGYAVDSADTITTNIFPVTQRIAAGNTATALIKGSVARIFTGAMLPEGANAVVMQEDTTQLSDNRIQCTSIIHSGLNVRRLGSELTQGQSLLTGGTRLTPAALSLCASVGIHQLSTFRPLNIALLTTGSELVNPGHPLQTGQTYNSNQYLLGALLREHGFEVTAMGIVADNLQSTIDTLRTAAQYDVIISTGGVSVGEEDHVRHAVQTLGHIDAWRVKMKPGKPFAYGKVGEIPFFGLPGNPVSAFSTFHLFVLPTLQRLQGLKERPITPLPVMAEFDFNASPRREYLRARLVAEDQQLKATIFSNQNSSVIASVQWADGFAVIQEDKRVHSGDIIPFIPFSAFKQ